MELQLGLALPIHSSIDGFNHSGSGCSENKKYVKNKRSYEESFGHFLKPLPLLVWSGQPNEEDDRNKKMNTNIHTSNNEGENHLVGWPPIKSWRKKELHDQQHHGHIRIDHRMQGNENQDRRLRPLYVKVNMEGVAIGRQVNLRLYNSYHTLKDSLINMFVKYQNFEEDGVNYTLIFQNKQGDWLLTEHIPWQSFIGTVRRLAILGNEKMKIFDKY
ncbi:auxin-responsive protein IAA29 [Trifolium pratense]|uniref:auxin-responsive protein IAA29 n=1 Tax=Trifolium pratense TaxID=57577 RepID=UPI001E694A1B|nr:auxin-responsive protein IAA29 [Trifolium pratense]